MITANVKEPANATEFLKNSFYYVYNWKNIAYCQGAVATFLLGVLLNKKWNKIMKNLVIFKKGSFVFCIREIKV